MFPVVQDLKDSIASTNNLENEIKEIKASIPKDIESLSGKIKDLEEKECAMEEAFSNMITSFEPLLNEVKDSTSFDILSDQLKELQESVSSTTNSFEKRIREIKASIPEDIEALPEQMTLLYQHFNEVKVSAFQVKTSLEEKLKVENEFESAEIKTIKEQIQTLTFQVNKSETRYSNIKTITSIGVTLIIGVGSAYLLNQYYLYQ